MCAGMAAGAAPVVRSMNIMLEPAGTAASPPGTADFGVALPCGVRSTKIVGEDVPCAASTGAARVGLAAMAVIIKPQASADRVRRGDVGGRVFIVFGDSTG